MSTKRREYTIFCIGQWIEVERGIFRSWKGARKIDGLIYNGPVYSLFSSKRIKMSTKRREYTIFCIGQWIEVERGIFRSWKGARKIDGLIMRCGIGLKNE